MKQLKRAQVKKLFKSEAENNPPKVKVTFLLQSFENATNVGSMFRLAEACGCEELILSGVTPKPPHSEISLTAVGQEKRVPWVHFSQVEEAIEYAKDKGYKLLALETTQNAKPYNKTIYPPKVCFVLGNESNGVFPQTLSRCDSVVFIPMFGKNYSLNVHVSAAVVAFRALLG